jgi:hypothetical protein
MTMTLNKRDLRQKTYIARASRARGYARMLMPLALFALGTAAWQDPDLGPQLAEGLEEIRPVAAGYLADTPLENILGPVPEDEITAESEETGQITIAAGLPNSAVPVNRN